MQQRKEKIHFIAIGGSVMHNLAVALKDAGNEVSGSDDEIADPSRATLIKHGLLPDKEGWRPEKLDRSFDAVILGMHAKQDNPELIKAQQLGLKVFSFPEYIYEHSKNKQRIVIAGSHGKTTITAIVIHVLHFLKHKFDYVIGAKISGIENTVKLSDAPIIIIEGDEYLASALDPTPKFVRYQHHLGLISGISWDHANVFPTEEEYVKQFDLFADQTPKGGILIYCEQDSMALIIAKKERTDVLSIPYRSHPHSFDGTNVVLTNGKEKHPIKIFGNHNYQNISGAKEILKKIGVTEEQFFEAITSFEGASGRLQKIHESDGFSFYKDFAHAPSKVKATVKALKEIYPSRDLVACLELHTLSSLSKNFLPQYKDSLKSAQVQIVYVNAEKMKLKKLEPLDDADIRKAFIAPAMHIFNDAKKLEEFLIQQSWKNKNLLMMSSGNFGGLNITSLSQKLNHN
jgi:UDP-N-acetylmuramate: L-alanyl-gamma-D-glutamyl-meso-diaminopimelate ligase